MSAWSEAMKARWEALAKREKIIMGATIALALVAGIDLGIIEPLGRSVVTGRKDLDNRKVELDELVKQRKALQAEVEARKPVVTTQQETERALSKAALAGSIWGASQARAWREQVVRDYSPGLALASVAEQGDADPNLRGFFRHELALDARMTWSQAESFLLRQGQAAALSPIKLSLTAQEDGSLALRAQFSAVSHQQYWKLSDQAAGKEAK